MGAVTPLGCGVEVFWERLITGESGIDAIRSFDTALYEVHFGGECSDFDPTMAVERREVKRLDRFAQMAVAAAKECAADSGFVFDGDAHDPTRIGVIIGSGIGGLLEIEEQYGRLLAKGPSKVSAFTVPKLMANAASGNVSIRFNAQGPNTAVTTACASASHAMGDALTAIKKNEADVMFTGGAEAALTPLGLAAFQSMKALSKRNDAPQHASRPFDRDRDGFVMGEGSGVLLFEELEHARKRGAKIYAEVVSVGSSGDAGHITQPAEDGHGAVKAMTMAMESAGIGPSDVDYINAHGTSTPLGDVAETVAIKSVFGPAARTVVVSSTKSSIGHLLGASGGVEMIATVLGIKNNIAPPTINLQNPDPDCDLDYVPNNPRDMKIDIAMSNSFGFGGHNACVCVRKYE
jgi:3-oxoacyl-[acyl-carrier-protein] synthase II